MSNYILSCCSTADMQASWFEERNIPFVCFHLKMDGKEYLDDLGKSIPFHEFYTRIAQGSEPTTSFVTVGEYVEFFEPFLAAGKDILHISFSSGLSGSYNSACLARVSLIEKYPERRIEIIDSLGASSGYGMLVDYLADMRDAGGSIEELRAWAEANKLHIHHWFFSTDLTSYKRGGRINAPEAAIATILGICPLLNMDAAGRLVPREKIRTKKRVIKEMAIRMLEHANNGADYIGKCFISHSDCLEDAEAVRDEIIKLIPNMRGQILINYVGTLIGSHTGPGTVALYFLGDRRQSEVPSTMPGVPNLPPKSDIQLPQVHLSQVLSKNEDSKK